MLFDSPACNDDNFIELQVRKVGLVQIEVDIYLFIFSAKSMLGQSWLFCICQLRHHFFSVVPAACLHWNRLMLAISKVQEVTTNTSIQLH